MEALRNSEIGKAGWVIGNGPSLTTEDLSLLRGKLTIASNKIFLAFPETDWTPDFYTVTDQILWPKIAQDLPLELGRVFLSPRLDSSLTPLHTVLVQARHTYYADSFGKEFFLSDPSNGGFFIGRTVTILNLQLAIFLGLNPIFLLGIDHKYLGADGQPGIVRNSVQNHFHADYRSPGEIVFGADLLAMTKAYAEILKWSGDNKISILNASRFSALDVFPRIEFEEALAFE